MYEDAFVCLKISKFYLHAIVQIKFSYLIK